MSDNEETLKKQYPIPATIGGCIDRLWTLDTKGRALAQQMKELDAESYQIEQHLLTTLPNAQLNGAQGKRAKVTIEPHDNPSVKDWTKTFAYIARTKSWDLLYKRLSAPACRERWHDKKVIPGVEIFTVRKLHLTQRKEK